jgi:hypothetical protein
VLLNVRTNSACSGLRLSACALSLAYCTMLLAGQNAPPPPPPLAVTVTAGAGDGYKTRVKFNCQGMAVDAATQALTPIPQREEELVLVGGNDVPLEFKVSVSTNRDATIHVEGTVTDYYGNEVPDAKLSADILAKPGKPAIKAHSVTPSARNVGPFYFAGTWAVVNGDAKGSFAAELGRANASPLVEDFEELKYKQPNAPLENSPAAQHHGQSGLLIKLAKAQGKDAVPPSQAIAIGQSLPGRPVKLGMWLRSGSSVRLKATIRDADVTVGDKKIHNTWEIGPLVVDGGDWRFVELPLPAHARPAAQAGLPNDTNAWIHYPLMLEQISISGAPEQTIFLDEISVATQRDVIGSVAFGESCPRIPFSFSGWRIHTGGGLEGVNNRKGETYIFPAAGKPIELKLAAGAFGSDKSVHFEATVRDYFGVELPKISADLAVKSGDSAAQSISINPSDKHAGPFYLSGTWSEVNGTNKETFSLTFAQANWHLVLEDFEQVRYPDPGGALENSAQAKHRGDIGLIVRPNGAKQSVPLSLTLGARPSKIGMWVKSAAAAKASLRVRDPGINHMGGMRYDAWTVGPVEISAGDWQYVEIPMPDYSAAKAQRKSYCEPNGVVDYPLTLEEIEFAGPAGNDIFVDDVELWSQGEQVDSTFIRATSSKASSLLYRTDSVNVTFANAWLWGEPLKATCAAALMDVSGHAWPLIKEGTAIEIPPGAELQRPCAVQNLPLGTYRVVAEAKSGAKALATIPAPKSSDEPVPDPAFLVYEPTGKPISQIELHKLLRDRNRLIAELGFTRDNRLFTWHSTQNTPAMENFTGYFYCDWLMPEIKAKREAGLEVIGTLGFTPQFYDPSARFIVNYNEWFGSTVAMPSRSIYFEEYAHRTIEHFAGKVSTWVVWERPDVNDFATPEEYTDKMLEVAKRAATEANPDAKLISGAITRENIEKYLTGMIEAGAHRYVDGIGILPSPAPLPPEDGYLDVILARAQRLRKQEQVKPEFWVLNLGWSTGDGAERVSELEQALYIPRAYVMCRAQGINTILIQPDGTEATAKRDSADLIYPQGNLLCLKPAALSVKTVQTTLKDAQFVRELFLNDRRDGLSRAYLFKQPDGKLILAAWRREGACSLQLKSRPDQIVDAFGNSTQPGSNPVVTLRPSPQYIVFAAMDASQLARQIERATLEYEDAAESAWKRQFTFYLDVGDAEDEKAAQYSVTQGRLVGPVDSYYHTEYGRHVVDTGRHFKGEEKFVVDVSKFGASDLLLRKRINYSLLNQIVKVYCNDEFVGQWAAPKRDMRYRWRDIEYVVPNKFFAGKTSAALRFVAQGDTEASSYCYWGGPIQSKTIYLSDLSLLYGTAGGAGPMVNLDKNVVGTSMKFFKKPAANFTKGIGTNAGARFEESLVVLSLNKQFKRLRGTVGVDACTNGRGTVRFAITGLNKPLWQSPDMTYYSEPKEFDIDVSNEIILMLSVNDSGDGPKDDIANWAGLQLELK